MSVYVVVRSVWADWADHPTWHDEEGELTLERGYWTSQDAAEDWIRAQTDRRVDYERDTWRNSLGAEEAKNVQMNRRLVGRQKEWDAIKAAGLTPSFTRPETKPFVRWEFDEERVRREIRQQEMWTIEKLEEHTS